VTVNQPAGCDPARDRLHPSPPPARRARKKVQ
jgi:hypothetical protein